MKRKTLLLCIAVVVFLGVFALHLFSGLDGVDFRYGFYDVMHEWLHEGVTYHTLAYNPPWTWLFLLPFYLMQYHGAQAALMMFTLAVIIRGWWEFLPGKTGFAAPISLAMCIFNLHIFDLVLRTQLDGFILLGVILVFVGLRKDHAGWLGLGWVFAVVRVSTDFLTGFYSMYVAWRRGLFWRALLIPVGMFIASMFIFGYDWSYRLYVLLTEEKAPWEVKTWITTWWRAAEYLEISRIVPFMITVGIALITLWTMRHEPDLRTAFAFMTVSTFLITPYALSYHYSTMMVVFVPYLVHWKLWMAVPLYLLTLVPVLRVIWGAEVAWL
ncbi:MAG TPA: hypothetical protein VJZ27_17175, partial [Aggregatilineales bacterium]|nr:hypothetical protein [Aggregatilineales bacterium]